MSAFQEQVLASDQFWELLSNCFLICEMVTGPVYLGPGGNMKSTSAWWPRLGDLDTSTNDRLSDRICCLENIMVDRCDSAGDPEGKVWSTPLPTSYYICIAECHKHLTLNTAKLNSLFSFHLVSSPLFLVSDTTIHLFAQITILKILFDSSLPISSNLQTPNAVDSIVLKHLSVSTLAFFQCHWFRQRNVIYKSAY